MRGTRQPRVCPQFFSLGISGLLAAFASVGSYAEVSVRPVPGDPLTLQPPPGVNPGFGRAVAISGDTMVVGHPYTDGNRGSVSIFIRNMPGEESSGWTQLGCPSACSTGILSRTTSVMEYLGWSVAIDGDTIVVGAPWVTGASSDEGAIFVFERDTPGSLTSSWSQVVELSNPKESGAFKSQDRFGYCVAIDGDTIVASTNPSSSTYGAAFVFVRDPEWGWMHTAQLADPVQAESGPFADVHSSSNDYGSSVAVSGNTVAVSASGTWAGYVSIFVRSDPDDLSSAWEVDEVINQQSTIAGLGAVVAIDGDTLVASSPSYDSYKGAAWVYTREADHSWIQRAKLQSAATRNTHDEFGTGLAISGDTIVVGNSGLPVSH